MSTALITCKEDGQRKQSVECVLVGWQFKSQLQMSHSGKVSLGMTLT